MQDRRGGRAILELLAASQARVSTVLHGVEAGAFDPAAMLTMHENGRIVGALLRTAGQPALVSAVPPRCAAAVVDALLRRGLDPVGAQGPREEVEAFATAWTARTGTSAELGMRMRLFALTELRPPAGVPGSARALDPDDEAGINFLAAWRQAFDAELAPTWPHPPTTRDDLVRALIAGAGELLWEPTPPEAVLGPSGCPPTKTSRTRSIHPQVKIIHLQIADSGQTLATVENRTAGQRPYRPVLAAIADSGFKSLAEVAHSEIVVYVRPPSLHDAEGEMRDTCALDHPGAFQLNRLGALVEQPDAIPK